MTSIIASILLSITSILHVGLLSEYYFYQEKNTLQIKVVLEKDEMMRLKFKSGCDVQKLTSFCISTHILKNLVVEINNELVYFEMGDSYSEKGHLIIYLSGRINNDNINSINIKNTSFYTYYSNYRNRIILDFGKIQRSYMLTASKNHISVQ